MVSTDPSRAVYSYVSPNSGGQLWGPFCVDCMNGIHALKTSSFYSNLNGEETLPIYLHTKSGGKVFKINQLIYRNGSSTPFLFHKLPAEFELLLMNCLSNDCKNQPQPSKSKTVQTAPVPCKTKWSQTDPTVSTASQPVAKENSSSQGLVKPRPDVTIPPATLTTTKAVAHLPNVENSIPFKVECSTRFPLMFGTKKRDVPPVGPKEWNIRAKNIDRLLNTMTPHDQQQFSWYLEQRNWKADRCVCDVCPTRLLSCGYIKHVISDAHRENLIENGRWVTRSHFNILEKFLVLVLNQLYGRDIHDMKSGAASFMSLQPFPLLQLSKQSYEGITSPQIITELQKKTAKIEPCVIDDHFPGLFLDIERCAFCSEVVSPKTVVQHVLSDKHMKLVLTRGQKPPSYDLLRLDAFLDLTIAGDSIESAGLSPPSTKWSPVDTTNRKASEMPLMAFDSSFGGRVLTRFEFDKGMKSMVDQLAQTDIDKFDTKFNSWSVEPCQLCSVKLSNPSDLVKHLATNKKHQDMIFASGTVTIKDINEYLNRMKEAAVRPLSVISSGSVKSETVSADSLPQKVPDLSKIPTVFTPTVTKTPADTKTKAYFPFLTGFNRTECSDIMPLDDVEKALSFWLKRIPDLMSTLTKLLSSLEISKLDLNCYYCGKKFPNSGSCLQHCISSRHLNKVVDSGLVFSRSKDYVAALQILENARRKFDAEQEVKKNKQDEPLVSGTDLAKKSTSKTEKYPLSGGATVLDRPVIKPQEERKPVKPVVEVVPQCSVQPVQAKQAMTATPQSGHTIITAQSDFASSKSTLTAPQSDVSTSRIAPTPAVPASVGPAANRVLPEPAKKQPEVRRVTPLPSTSRDEPKHTFLENKAIGSAFPLLGFFSLATSSGESPLSSILMRFILRQHISNLPNV